MLGSLLVDIVKIECARTAATAFPTRATTLPEQGRRPGGDGILGLADRLGVDIVAKSVEEAQQVDLVRALGCRLGQGPLLARPAPAPVVVVFLASGAKLDLDPRPAVV